MSLETESVYKFSFIGPASVGKTTQTDILRHRFVGNPAVAFVEEGAKLYFESGRRLPDSFVDRQKELQDFVRGMEIDALGAGVKIVITDRTVLDPVVYTAFFDTPAHADLLLARVADWLPTYTLFMLLDPVGVPDDPRPAKLETPQQRLNLYHVFKQYCIDNGLPLLEVSGSLAERVQQVESAMSEYAPVASLMKPTTGFNQTYSV